MDHGTNRLDLYRLRGTSTLHEPICRTVDCLGTKRGIGAAGRLLVSQFGRGTILLVYAISRVDPVIILGQALGVVVYSRNLVLIYRKKELPAAQGDVTENEDSLVLSVPEATSSVPLRRVG